MNVLITDDFEPLRRVMSAFILETGKHEILHANDGEEAMQILQTEKIDFLVLDWAMPNKSGLDVIKWMKAQKSLRNIPIMLVSGETNREEIVLAVDLGINGFVAKPFTKTVFLSKFVNIVPPGLQ